MAQDHRWPEQLQTWPRVRLGVGCCCSLQLPASALTLTDNSYSLRHTCGMCCFPSLSLLAEQRHSRYRNTLPTAEARQDLLVWKAHWGPLQGWTKANWGAFCDAYFSESERKIHGVAAIDESSKAKQFAFRGFHGLGVIEREARFHDELRSVVFWLCGKRQPRLLHCCHPRMMSPSNQHHHHHTHPHHADPPVLSRNQATCTRGKATRCIACAVVVRCVLSLCCCTSHVNLPITPCALHNDAQHR